MRTLIFALLIAVPVSAQEAPAPLDNWWQEDTASWLVLPRTLMAEMPDDWQTRMDALLDEWNDTWNMPPYEPTVSLRNTRTGRFAPLPDYLTDWVNPRTQEVESLRK